MAKIDEVNRKLAQLVSIESVSTDSKRRKQMDKAVEYIKGEMESIGMVVEEFNSNNCPSLVIGKKIMSESAETIGIYAHYDVQPEDPVDKWTSPPFNLTKRGNKLYGRGVADDKMHLIQSVIAVKNLIAKKMLKNNIVFIFEGEEETGSDHFEELVKKAGDDLRKIDVFYILDMGMKAVNVPQIFYGLRGIAGFELKIKTGESDLHSGVYGNRVLNPAQVAADLFSKMKDSKGKILIPGFYDKVKKFTEDEIAVLSKFVPNEENERETAKVNQMVGGFLESKIKPSLDINGVASGYAGQGFKTIIPCEATIKFSIRLVEYQNGPEIIKLVEKFVAGNLPEGVDHEFIVKEAADPFYTDYTNPYAIKTAKILEEVFGGECFFNRSGGSIAAAEILQKLYKKPIILTGFTLPDENIHAPDENVDLNMFEKGIVALERIFSS